jgi:hypothetical protein
MLHPDLQKKLRREFGDETADELIALDLTDSDAAEAIITKKMRERSDQNYAFTDLFCELRTLPPRSSTNTTDGLFVFVGSNSQSIELVALLQRKGINARVEPYPHISGSASERAEKHPASKPPYEVFIPLIDKKGQEGEAYRKKLIDVLQKEHSEINVIAIEAIRECSPFRDGR